MALTDSRFMAGGCRPDFYCLSPCYLSWFARSSQKDYKDWWRGGSIRTDLDGTLITMMGVQEKVGRVDLSGDPAFAPQNPNTPLEEQDPQMFIFAIPRTVIAVRFKVGAD